MDKRALIKPETIHMALRQDAAHSPQSRFVHRLHCMVLVAMGRSCREVADLFGDNPRSIERWVQAFQKNGVEGLREKSHSGRYA